MKPHLSGPVPRAVLRCDLLASAGVRVTAGELPALRKCPGPGYRQPVSPAFLKHADDQTVAGLAAVLQAIARDHLGDTDFSDWGAVAAARFLGRATLAEALAKYAAEGPWGVSPHLIPHRSQHALSGTLSQVLRMHGPNFGSGSGPEGAVEALRNGLTLLQGDRLPGVWVVLTGWSPGTDDPACQAVALALVPCQSDRCRPRLTLKCGGAAAPGLNRENTLSLFQVEKFWSLLTEVEVPVTAILGPLDGGDWLELERGARTEDVPAGQAGALVGAGTEGQP